MAKFRKKPVVIEAVLYGGSTSDISDIREWMGTGIYNESQIKFRDLRSMRIDTLEGVMTVSPGDYIIRGVKGEFYPCKPDIFAATYELVEE